MTLYESPTECFDRLTKDSGRKFITALERIKDACDKLENVGADINYSSVGKMAVSLHGGPKPQSILNNAKHKTYIDTRKKRDKKSFGALNEVEDAYPASNLDQRTKQYIDRLKQRNNLLENAMQELKQRLKLESTQNPVDVSLLIGNDVEVNRTCELSGAAKDTLLTLLNQLPSISDEIELYEQCSLRYRTGEWAIPPSIYKEIIKHLTSKSQ